MKAKEYAKIILDKYIETDVQTCIQTAGVQTIQGLCAEYEELCKKRNLIRTDGIGYNGMLNLLKEFNIKWLSICRHVNKEVLLLDENGWSGFIQDTMPGIYPNYIQTINP
jgi:hypothetical protein